MKKKNYSEAKIKEIKKKLVELGVEVSLDTQGTPETVISEESVCRFVCYRETGDTASCDHVYQARKG